MIESTDDLNRDRGLSRILEAKDFSPAKFIKNQRLTKSGTNTRELKSKLLYQKQQAVERLNQEVFDNHLHINDVVEDLKDLQSSMHSLHQLFSEERQYLSSLLAFDELSLRKPITTEEEDQDQLNLALLLEKVDGCSTIADVPGRILRHEDLVTELNLKHPHKPVEGSELHLYLLSDALLIAKVSSDEGDAAKEQLESLIDLDSVNVTTDVDLPRTIRNCFKLLNFPQSRLLQAKTPHRLTLWMNSVTEAKTKRRNETGAVGRYLPHNIAIDISSLLIEEPEHASISSDLLRDKLGEWLDNAREKDRQDELTEAAELLDVLVSQRDFEGAVKIILKINSMESSIDDDDARIGDVGDKYHEIMAFVKQRTKYLTDRLLEDLSFNEDRSLRSGSTVVKRAMVLLIELGKVNQAVQLFLRNRKNVGRHQIASLRLASNAASYIENVSVLFFSNLAEASRELDALLPRNTHPSCYSALLVWLSGEVKFMIQHLKNQLFTTKVMVDLLADAVKTIRLKSAVLFEFGFSAEAALLSELKNDVVLISTQQKQQLIRAIHKEFDSIRFDLLKFDAVRLPQVIEEYKIDFGLDLSSFVGGEAENTLMLDDKILKFSKTLISFTLNIAKLYFGELANHFTELLRNVLIAVDEKLMKILSDPKRSLTKTYVDQNIDFLFNHVYVRVLSGLQPVVGPGASSMQLSFFDTFTEKRFRQKLK